MIKASDNCLIASSLGHYSLQYFSGLTNEATNPRRIS